MKFVFQITFAARGLLFFLFSSVLFQASQSYSNTLNCTEQNSYPTSLSCWLTFLSVHIPDQSFHKGFLTISTHDLICSNFSLAQIQSHRSARTTASDTDSIALQLMDVQATCSGTYRVGLAGGSVILQVKTLYDGQFFHHTHIHSQDHNHSSALEWNHTLHSGIILDRPRLLWNETLWSMSTAIPIPQYVNTTDCAANFEVPSKGIVFSGSISADIVELFASPIGRHVEHVLNSGSCTFIEFSWTPKINRCLSHFHDWVQEFLTNNSLTLHDSDDHVDDTEDYLHWNDIPMIQGFLHKFNSFLNNHLNDGFLLSWLRYFNFKFNSRVNELDCGLFFRGVNGLIRSWLGNSISGAHSLNVLRFLPTSLRRFNFTFPHLGNISLHIYNITCEGMDTVQSLGLYTNVSNTNYFFSTGIEGLYLSPDIALDRLACRSDINVLVVPENTTSGGLIQDISLDENFTLAFNASSLSMTLAMNIGILKSKLDHMTFNNIFKNDTHVNWEALLLTVGCVDIEQFEVAAKFDGIIVNGLSSYDELETSMDQLINNIFGMVVDNYSLMISDIIGAFARGPIRRSLNTWIKSLLQTSRHKEDFYVNTRISEAGPVFYYFNESNVIKEVSEFLSRQEVLSSLNSYSSCVATFLENVEHESDFMPQVLFELKSFFFDNVIFDSLSLFAEDLSHLSVIMKLNESIQGFLRVMGALEYPSERMSASYNTTVNFASLSIIFGSNVLYDIGLLGNFSILSVLLDPLYILHPLSISSGLYGSKFHMNDTSLDLDGILSTQDRVRNISFYTKNATATGTRLTDAINMVVSIFQSITNGMINIFLGSISRKYPICSTPDISKDSFSVDVESYPIYFITIAMLFIALNSYYFVTQGDCWNLDYVQRNVDTPSGPKQSRRKKSMQSSMMFHKRIPDDIRVLVPCVIIASIGVFVVSSFATGASVDLQISSSQGIEIAEIPGFTTFSLGTTIAQMYNAKVFLLMFLVLVFSGIWPYIKLILMLTSFIMPTSWLAVKNRERLLTMLDAMGKYSLVDSFVLVLMLVSFRFHLELPDVGIIDSYVTPEFGFYSFLSGTIMSLLIGHGVTFLHRYSSMPQAPSSPTVMASRMSVKQHSFEVRDFYGYAQSAKLTTLASVLWFIAVTGTLILLIVGSLKECIVFQFQGITGELLGEDKDIRYSLLSLGASLSDSARNPSDKGITVIKWTYFFFAIIMPCLGQVIILALSYVPLTLKNFQRLLYTAEICNAWSATEVFVLSVLASILELHHFSDFMIGNRCDFLHNPLISELTNGRTVCFGVESRVTNGIWYLCMGVLLNSFVFHFGLKVFHTVVKERMVAEAWIHPSSIMEEPNEFWNEIEPSVIERLMKNRFVGNMLVHPHSQRTI